MLKLQSNCRRFLKYIVILSAYVCFVHLEDDYHLIKPIIILNNGQITETTLINEDGLHAELITIKLHLYNKTIILDLHLNSDFLPQDHFMSYQLENGDKHIKNFTKYDVDLCHYHGEVTGKSNTKVALSTCDGIRGVIFCSEEIYHIVPRTNGDEIEHYLIREPNNKQEENDLSDLFFINSTFNRSKRSPKEPYDSDENSSYVELLLVADKYLFEELGHSLTRVHRYCKDLVNILNAIYKPLNIYFALIGLEVWNIKSPIAHSANHSILLDNFVIYSQDHLLNKFKMDNAQLISRQKFPNTHIAGLGVLGGMCSTSSSYGICTNSNKNIAMDAFVVAHEIGHNFGMEHDVAECNCVQCVMSSGASNDQKLLFSVCSKQYLEDSMKKHVNICLKNKPTKLFDSPVCGNGFTESGEECDCGLPENCKNTCCDPFSCKLQPNATCAAGKCCNTESCSLKERGTVCREAIGECDLPEFCNGKSEFCHADLFKRNTEDCGSGEYCFDGKCSSHDRRCKFLWGPSAIFSRDSYNQMDKNSYCGTLYCANTGTFQLMSSMMGKRINSRRPSGYIIKEYSLEPNLLENYHVAPNGAKCAEGMVCLNQKCESVASYRTENNLNCSENCNGHGVCNSNGNCHCDNGFAPPFCLEPGNGGSNDSAPKYEDTYILRTVMILLLAIVSVGGSGLLYSKFKKKPALANLQTLRRAPDIPMQST